MTTTTTLCSSCVSRFTFAARASLQWQFCEAVHPAYSIARRRNKQDFAVRHNHLQSFVEGEDMRKAERRTRWHEEKCRRGKRHFLLRCMQSGDAASEATEETTEIEYAIRITTSKEAGSSLSQPESGVMVGLLGTEERFLLHKLDNRERQFEGGKTAEELVQGQSIGGIQSVWLSPVRGTWRPQSVSVLVKDGTLKEKQQLTEDSEVREESEATVLSERARQENIEGLEPESSPSGTLYSFEWREGLIGEGCEHSAAQLALHSAVQIEDLGESGFGEVPTVSDKDLAALRNSGLAEYSELKTFLLGTTAALVGAGTLSSGLVFSRETSIGFAVGGSAGLLYLLLLQRTVDQLGNAGRARRSIGVLDTSDATNQSAGRSGSPFNRILDRLAMIAKGPATRIVLLGLIVLVLAKAFGASDLRTVEPQQVLAGLAGFLVYKIAVLLAAFRPSKSTLNS